MSINILVTEDESIVRKDIEQTLEKIGYNVVATADNGEDAIDLAVRHRPDVVLMDIMLKGDMNGIAAAEETAHVGCADHSSPPMRTGARLRGQVG